MTTVALWAGWSIFYAGFTVSGALAIRYWMQGNATGCTACAALALPLGYAATAIGGLAVMRG